MDPIAFEWGPISVRWYGVLIALAFLIGVLGSGRDVRKRGLNEDAYYSVLIWVIVMALLGARLYYVIFEWSYYSQHLSEIPAVWQGGLAVHGGIFAGLITLYLASRRYGFPFATLADIIAPYLILGQAIGRWGNFFNQEAYGYEVNREDVPWAMYIDGAWRHPTFLYESLWNALGFVMLLVLGRRRHRTGDIALCYFMYYSFGRFFIEGLRTDSLMIGGLRTAQLVSLSLFVVAAALYAVRRVRAKRSAETDRKADDQSFGR